MPDSAIKMTRLQMAAVESHAVEHPRLFTHRLAHIPFIHSSVRENTETTPRRRSSTHGTPASCFAMMPQPVTDGPNDSDPRHTDGPSRRGPHGGIDDGDLRRLGAVERPLILPSLAQLSRVSDSFDAMHFA